MMYVLIFTVVNISFDSGIGGTVPRVEDSYSSY